MTVEMRSYFLLDYFELAFRVRQVMRNGAKTLMVKIVSGVKDQQRLIALKDLA